MNPKYFGDSYDIVKRFFCIELRELGYSVSIVPMFTGDWNGNEAAFFRFLGVEPKIDEADPLLPVAVFFDPDTGVRSKGGSRHLSLQQFITATRTHSLTFSFDQSFSRQHLTASMHSKLEVLKSNACHGMYYDSHARFLFASLEANRLIELRTHLISVGIPASRLVTPTLPI